MRFLRLQYPIKFLLNHCYLTRCLNLNHSFSKMKGIVLGVYTESGIDKKEISSGTASFTQLDEQCGGKLMTFLKGTGAYEKSIKQKLLWIPMLKDAVEFDCVSVIDLGNKEVTDNPNENLDQKSENVRVAVAHGVKALRAASDFEDIFVDSCDSPQSAAESAHLTLHSYVALKSSHRPFSYVSLHKYKGISDDVVAAFAKGALLAECQNFARFLSETPSNHMTPTIFVETVREKLKDSDVQVVERDMDWAESMKMGSFLSVTRGSDEKAKFLELHYNGNPESDKCIALVGKGITFDTGGISLKSPTNMDLMRADMGGGAVVVSTVLAVSKLNFKVNLKAFVPLTDNMPSGKATKPGDVVRAMNGKTITVDNTDAEGRLVLCDALTYAQQFKPLVVMDIATLTGSSRVALGEAAGAAYCNNEQMWKILNEAQFVTGDRLWRMPLFKYYVTRMINKSMTADINNVDGPSGGSCTAAGFLSEFIDNDVKWIHLDIACTNNTIDYTTNSPYMGKGMSGRPMRTVVQFVQQLENEFL